MYCNSSKVKFIFKFFLLLQIFFITSCGSFIFPALEIDSVNWNDEKITLEFSKAPTEISILQAFSLTEDNTYVNGTFEFIENKVIFYPVCGIKKNYNYELKISTKAEDNEGLSLSNEYNYCFTTRDECILPYVVSCSIQDESEVSELLEPLDKISILFSEPVDVKSFDKSFSISPSLDLIKVFSEDGTSVDLIPKEKLSANTEYTMTISSSLADCSRNNLEKDYKCIFYYGKDNTIPKYNVSFIGEDAAKTALTEKSLTSGLSSKGKIRIDFTQKMNLNSLSAYIDITPSLLYTITTDNEDLTFAEINLSSALWNKEYSILIKDGICNTYNNKTTDLKEFSFCCNSEETRPVEFICGFMQTGEWTKGSLKEDTNYIVISEDNNYKNINLIPTYFIVDDIVNCSIYFIFSYSSKAENLNIYSLFDSLSFSTTNSCVNLIAKKIELVTDSDKLAFPLSELYTQKFSSNVKTAVVKATVELTNSIKPGLLKINLSKDINDSLGNCMQDSLCFTYNK